MSEIKFEDIKATSYEISLSKLTTKKIVDIHGMLSKEFGDIVFNITRIVFEDGSIMGVEGEHDFPYAVEYKATNPMPNFDDETLERLYGEDPDNQEDENDE